MLIFFKVNSQNPKWSRNGDNVTSGEWLGTTNSEPLLFKSNNNLGIRINPNGEIDFKSLDLGSSSSPSGLVLSDWSGKIFRKNLSGNANEYFDGSGTWSPLPAGATSWQLVGNNLLAVNSGNVGIGTNNPMYKLDVIGDARVSNNLYVGAGIVITDKVQAAHEVKAGSMRADTIFMDQSKAIYGTTRVEGDIDAKNKLDVQGNATFNGTLKLSQLGGSAGPLLVDNLGNVFKGIPAPQAGCIPGNPQWTIGGDNFQPYSNGTALINQGAVGTCNNYDFVLKSNGVNRTFLKTDGSVTFGIDLLSNTGGPQYRFHNGPVRLSGAPNGFGAPILVFDGGTSPFGDWGIEYIDNTIHTQFNKSGLNFWKPFGSQNGANALLYLANDGKIGINTDNPISRLTIEAWSGDGLRLVTDNASSKPISVNYNNGSQILENLVVNGDGVTWIGNNVMSVGSSQLVVGQGNKTSKALSLVDNSTIANKDYFNVYGSGYTEIKVYSPGILPNNRAFAIKDMANTKDLFVVKSDGKTYAREVEISLVNNFPDYVFSKDYKLKPLNEVEAYINQNKHLPNFEKGEHYEKNGINVTDLLLKQQQTIEELMLYNIELEKRLKALEQEK
jgi:hypothetical protein